jgi:hypothetical protein
MVECNGCSSTALQCPRASISDYIQLNDAEYTPYSLRRCLAASYGRIGTPDTPLKSERTLCPVRSFFSRWLISDWAKSRSPTTELWMKVFRGTLFLHEDVLARALAYEQELQRWRIAELNAGRGDPGRPMYDEVSGYFNPLSVMSHQCFRCLVA